MPDHCRACGHSETDADPLITVPIPHADPMPVHTSHTTDPRSGLYGTEPVTTTEATR